MGKPPPVAARYDDHFTPAAGNRVPASVAVTVLFVAAPGTGEYHHGERCAAYDAHHADGAFLLLRTYPYWEHQLSVRILMALLGLVAAAMAAGFARVQSSVKRRVAYVSMAHNGLIFIEVAAGFKSLALIHIAANAFLGAYRLLVQPSVVVSGAGARTISNRKTWEDRLPKKLKYTIYMLDTREWGLYARFSRYLRS